MVNKCQVDTNNKISPAGISWSREPVSVGTTMYGEEDANLAAAACLILPRQAIITDVEEDWVMPSLLAIEI